LVAIHILGGMAQVLDRSFLVAVERDWIVVMSEAVAAGTEHNKDVWLSRTNVALKQIDLTCQVIAPAVTGWVLSLLPTKFGILWVGLCNCLALLVELVSVKIIARLLPTLDQAKNAEENKNSALEEESPYNHQETAIELGTNCGSGWNSLQIYLQQSMSFAGLGLALLYFNVLTFSGMMTAYLISEGMTISTIGMWRGVASVIGLLATCIYHKSVNIFSLQFTALWSIVWELTCLSLTFASIFVHNNQTVQLTLLIGGVIPSRIGLWVYDIAVTQLFQESVADTVRGQVGGTQMSLNALMEMLPFGLAFLFHKPSQFYVLIVSGYLAVALAMLLYTVGFYLPYLRRRQYERAPSTEMT
jgi:iron-regulated transporter 1